MPLAGPFGADVVASGSIDVVSVEDAASGGIDVISDEDAASGSRRVSG